MGDGTKREIITYNEILDHASRKNAMGEFENAFLFDEIVDHRKGENRQFGVLVKWATGEETWEPLRTIIKEDPVTLAQYAEKHNLLKTEQ